MEIYQLEFLATDGWQQSCLGSKPHPWNSLVHIKWLQDRSCKM